MPPRPAPALLLPLVLSLVPWPALACPTELGAGLVYVSDDGTATTVTPTDRPDVLTERVVLPDGDGYRISLLHGLFELEVEDFDATGTLLPETRMVSVFASPPALPEPGSAAQGILALVETPAERFERRHDVVAGPLAEVVLGGCTWMGHPVEITIDEGGEIMVQSYLRVPALGMAFFVGYTQAGMPERYEVVSVTALPAATPEK